MLFGVFKGSIMSLEPYIRLARKTNELSSKSLSKRILSRFVRSKLEVAKLTNNINRTRNLGKGEGVAEGNFGTVREGATAFVSEFHPLYA